MALCAAQRDGNFVRVELTCVTGAVQNNYKITKRSRAQYVEGIYDNPVTLKSSLRVTQGHWKRNHWVDHTRLTISRVI